MDPRASFMSRIKTETFIEINPDPVEKKKLKKTLLHLNLYHNFSLRIMWNQVAFSPKDSNLKNVKPANYINYFAAGRGFS